jgi:glycosyltransferase involved in cell wall biosynthesis
MKVLWVSPVPSKYENNKFGYNGGGWIESLQSLLENCTEIDQLAIAFPHISDSKKVNTGKVTYYPIRKTMPGNIFSWIISNWKTKIEQDEEINQLKLILDDFEPDVIHIFGTEGWFCHVIKMTSKPCIVHIQGLLLPCFNAYLPSGISKFDLIRNNWTETLKGISLWHDYQMFGKKSKREYLFFKDISFFMGRTFWDKSISGLLTANAKYFHIDEVLRDKFYSASPWKLPNTNKTIITSTLSDALYKGLDFVIKTCIVLANENFEFEWRIIGVNNNSRTLKLLKRIFKSAYPSEYINLLGVKNTDEIIEYLYETTFFVHPSYIDNSPNSLCEAQIMGVPVIATHVGGISSLIENGKNGYLVPVNDPYFLASRIVQLSKDHTILNDIAKQARIDAQKRHEKEDIQKQIISIYMNLANTNSAKVKELVNTLC